MIVFSSSPMVEMQYPRDQIPPFRIAFRMLGNRSGSNFPVCDFIYCMTLATDTRGGIITTMCTWSCWTLARITSISSSSPSRCISTLSRYCFTPNTNIRRRYRGVKTMWYSVLYTQCVLFRNLIHSIYLFLHIVLTAHPSPDWSLGVYWAD